MQNKFEKESDSLLVCRTRNCAQSLRKLTRELLERINEVDRRSLYADLGYSSLLDWVIKDLGFSETSALRRVKSAKQLHRMPGLADKIESGVVNLSTLSALQSAIQKEEQTTGKPVSLEQNSNLINAIESKSEFCARIEIAKNFPDQSTFRESLRPNSGETFELKIQLTSAEYELLKHVRDLSSHINFNASWSETIVLALKDYRKQNDPILQNQKHEIQKAKAALKKIRVSGTKPASSIDKDLTGMDRALKANVVEINQIQPPAVTQSLTGAVKQCVSHPGYGVRTNDKISLAEMKRLVKVRDQNKCKFKSKITGRTCESSYQVQVDHIIPRALGGENKIENMRCLCRTHNLSEARRWGFTTREKLVLSINPKTSRSGP